MKRIKLIKKALMTIIISAAMTMLFSHAHATPADENFDDDAGLVIGSVSSFTNDGIKYTLGDTPFDTIISNSSSCPLGDDGTDYFMGVGTSTSVTIEAGDGTPFSLIR